MLFETGQEIKASDIYLQAVFRAVKRHFWYSMGKSFDMDTVLLKTFLEVSRTHHFGKAADNLFVTQSTVSARIKLLEETVGTALFTRRRNNIQLTAAGARLVKYAEQIVLTWNRARQEIAIEEEAGVSLSVAGTPSLWDILLQDWLQTTCVNFPNLVLSAEVLAAETMTRRLLDGSLDLGFQFESPQSPELKTREIFNIPLVMVSSNPDSSTSEAIQGRYILVDWGTSFAIAHARHFPDVSLPSLRMGLGRMARRFLLDCGGSAYLAQPMVADDLREGRLYLVEDAPMIERTTYASYFMQAEKQQLLEQVLVYFDQLAHPAGMST